MAHSVSDQAALTLQHFNLPKLKHDLFGFVSLPSQFWSS
jgi:hypothetical protein